MASLEELRSVRTEKLSLLRDFGMDPFPASIPRTNTISEAIDSFETYEQSGQSMALVGRVMSLRGQGAIMFATLFDGTDRFQAVFKKDEIDTFWENG